MSDDRLRVSLDLKVALGDPAEPAEIDAFPIGDGRGRGLDVLRPAQGARIEVRREGRRRGQGRSENREGDGAHGQTSSRRTLRLRVEHGRLTLIFRIRPAAKALCGVPFSRRPAFAGGLPLAQLNVARYIRRAGLRGASGDTIPGALSILKGAVPDPVRGPGHTAPTYVRRFPGSILQRLSWLRAFSCLHRPRPKPKMRFG